MTKSANVTLIGALAADVMATAIVRAVRAASKLDAPGLPALPPGRRAAGHHSPADDPHWTDGRRCDR